MEIKITLVKNAKFSSKELLTMLEHAEEKFTQNNKKVACRRDIKFIKHIENGLNGLAEENFKEDIEIFWMKVNGWSRDVGGYLNSNDKRRFDKLSNKFWKDMLNLYTYIHGSS